MKYTKQQLTDIYNNVVDFDTLIDKYFESLTILFYGHITYEGPHPVDAIREIDKKLYDELTYILYECPDELCECEVGDKKIRVKGSDVDSFIRLCEVTGLLEKE